MHANRELDEVENVCRSADVVGAGCVSTGAVVWELSPHGRVCVCVCRACSVSLVRNQTS